MWHSTPATNYQARTYVHSRYHCMGLTSKRAIESWMSPHDFPQYVHSTYSDSVDLTSLGPLQVNVKYVLFREMFTSRCVSCLSARCTPPCHVRLKKTRQIARQHFLELPSQTASKLPASGRNSLCRPSRVPPRCFGTCRVAVAALVGTDRQNLRASYST